MSQISIQKSTAPGKTAEIIPRRQNSSKYRSLAIRSKFDIAFTAYMQMHAYIRVRMHARARKQSHRIVFISFFFYYKQPTYYMNQLFELFNYIE